MDFLRIAEWAGLCLFVTPALLVDLRLLGVASRHVRVSAVVQYVLPWTSTGLAVMAAARVVHLLATPTGLLSQPAFLVHLSLLGLLGLWRSSIAACSPTSSRGTSGRSRRARG